MAVTTKKTFSAADGSTKSFGPIGIELNNQDDLDVYVTLSGGTRRLSLRQSSDTTATSSHPQVNDTTGLYFPAVSVGDQLYNYSISTDNNNIVFNNNIPSGAVVSCERRTRDSSSNYTNFSGGSTIRSTDLNRAFDESNFTAQEARNKAFEIENKIFGTEATSTSFIDTNEIVDDAVTAAKIAVGAVNHEQLAVDAVRTVKIQDANITTAKIADDAVTAAKIAANSINHEQLADDAVRTVDIQDNAVTAAKLADNAVDTAAIGDSAVTSAKIADGTIVNADVSSSAGIAHSKLSGMSAGNVLIGNSSNVPNSTTISGDVTFNSSGVTTIGNGAVGNAKIADDAVTAAKIANNAVNHEQIVNDAVRTVGIQDSAVTTAKIAANAVTAAKIADATVNHEQLATDSVRTAKIQDANVTTAKLADNAVTAAKIADGTVNHEQLATDAVRTAKIQDNAVTADKIADAVIVTNSEQSGHSVNDTTFFTTSASDARYFNISSGDTIKDGDTFPDNDTTIATTAAINDRIIDLVDDVGGFVPIANETSFPNANPDVNNGAGTLVSIKALSSNLTSNGSGVATISNGTVGNSTVTINGLASSTTYAANFGMIVETTSTLNTYTFHRQVPIATEVSTVAGSISNVNTVAGDISNVNAVAGNATNINAVAGNNSNVTAVADNASNINSAVSNASNINSAVSNASNINTTAGSISNVNTVAGSISNVNSVASNMGTVNDFAARYRTGSSNPTDSLDVGDLFFNTSANELKVYNGSSWQGGVTASGSFAATTGNTWTGDNKYNDGVKGKFGSDSDLQIYHTGSASIIVDTNADSDLYIMTDRGGFLNQAGDEWVVKYEQNSFVQLFYDNSKKFETTSYGSAHTGIMRFENSGDGISLYDSRELKLGSGDDLKIYHDGTNSHINNTTGYIVVGTDSYAVKDQTLNEFYIKALKDGAVELYYDNVKTFATTTNGAIVYGTEGAGAQLYLYADEGDDNADKWRFSTGNDGDVYFQNYADGAWETNTLWKHGGAVELYHDNTKKFETNADGTLTQGTIQVDGAEGGTAQIRIHADEGDEDADKWRLIANTDSSFALQNYYSGSYENSIKATGDGNVELYYDNTLKLNTESAGTRIQGQLILPNTSGVSLSIKDGGKGCFGNGDDLQIYHDGSQSIINDTANRLQIRSDHIELMTAAGKNEYYLQATEDGAVELYNNNEKKFETISIGAQVTGSFLPDSDNVRDLGSSSKQWQDVHIGNDLYMADSAEARFGDGNDLKIYHDGTDSTIKNSTGYLYVDSGTSAIRLISDSSWADGSMAAFYRNGSVELYYDNVKKFETTSAGVTVTGTGYVSGGWRPLTDNAVSLGSSSYRWYDLNISNDINISDNGKVILGDGDDLQIYHDGSNSYIHNNTGRLRLEADNLGVGIYEGPGSETLAMFNIGAECSLYYDNSKKMQTTSWGVQVIGQLLVDDNYKLECGNGSDLQIFHDGSHTYIDNSTGELQLRSSFVRIRAKDDNETIATFNDDAEVALYYDGSQKFNTSSDGATCHGNLSFTDNNKLKLGTGDDLQIYHSGDDSIIKDGGTGGLYLLTNQFLARNVAGNETMIQALENDWAGLYYDNSLKFYTQSYGGVFAGTFKPSANSTHDLGDNSYRFNAIWARNTARSYINVDGDASTATIRTSYNVSSLTDDAYERHTVNFDTAMPNANYCFVSGARAGSSGGGGRVVVGYDTPTTSAFKYQMRNLGNSNEHVDAACLAFFSD